MHVAIDHSLQHNPEWLIVLKGDDISDFAMLSLLMFDLLDCGARTRLPIVSKSLSWMQPECERKV